MRDVKFLSTGAPSVSDAGSIRLAFARFNVRDAQGDVLLPGAIPTKDVLMSAFGHSSWPKGGGLLPVGKGTVRESGDVAVFDGAFFLDTIGGRATHGTVQGLGHLAQWSYAFDVLRSRAGMHEGQPARFLERLDVHEVAPVLLSVSDSATLSLKDRRPAGSAQPFLATRAERVAKARSAVALSSVVASASLVPPPSVDEGTAYVEIAPSFLIDPMRSLAATAAEMVADDLGLGWQPVLRYFAPVPSGVGAKAHPDAFRWTAELPVQGSFHRDTPDSLWLHAGLSGRELVRTVAHEASHALSFAVHGYSSDAAGRQREEAEAYRYESSFIDRAYAA